MNKMKTIALLFGGLLSVSVYAQGYPTPNTMPKSVGYINIIPNEMIKSPKIDGECKAYYYIDSGQHVFMTVDAVNALANFPSVKTTNGFVLLKPDTAWMSLKNKEKIGEESVVLTYEDTQNSKPYYVAEVRLNSKRECKGEKNCYTYDGSVDVTYNLQHVINIGSPIKGTTTGVSVKEYCSRSEYEKNGLMETKTTPVGKFFDFFKF